MHALLNSNIMIHHEACIVICEDIGYVFNWLDPHGYDKCFHPENKKHIEKHSDECIRISF